MGDCLSEAAPDLLKACREAEGAMREAIAKLEIYGTINRVEYLETFRSRLYELQNAISKAKGVESKQ